METRLRTALAVGAALVLGASLLAATSSAPDWSPSEFPGRTDLGVWDGTWAYESREHQIALWGRTRGDGQPEFMLQYVDLSTAESFRTDWNLYSQYSHRGRLGEFKPKVLQSDANVVSGEWSWHYGTPPVVRTETGSFVIYRGLEGRQLLLRILDFRRAWEGTTEKEWRLEEPFSWTFVKVSRRHARWGELAF